METMQADGTTRPSGGTLSAFVPACGPGIRVDTFGYAGYTPSGRFDALLAKLIAYHPSGRFEHAASRLQRALAEFHVDGVAVNIPFLQRLLQHPAFRSAAFHTRFIDDHLAELVPDVADEDAPVAPEAPVVLAPPSMPPQPVAASEPPPSPPAKPPEPKPATPPSRQVSTRRTAPSPSRRPCKAPSSASRCARVGSYSRRTTAGCGGIHEDGARGSRRRGRRRAPRRRGRGGRYQRGGAVAVRGSRGVGVSQQSAGFSEPSSRGRLAPRLPSLGYAAVCRGFTRLVIRRPDSISARRSPQVFCRFSQSSGVVPK